MKILWVSDSPTSPSGFGNVTRFVCDGLSRRGHQVSILGWQAHGSPSRWRECMLYPAKHNAFGADVLLAYLQRIQPDVLITLADVWWLTFIANPSLAGFMRVAGIPWVLYYPIDGDLGGDRLPPSWTRILQTVALPIAMSGYGRDVSAANGVVPAYIAHGVDIDVFAPPSDKPAAKRLLGYEGKFVVLSDARNQPRKMLPRTLDIFKRFAADKDDVILHLHCDKDDPAARTPQYHYDLAADIEQLGLSDRVRLTQDMRIGSGLPLDRLRAIYQAADVHLLSSWGEGFGLPTLQAASAGVVPMACDYTASRELTFGHGEPLRVADFILDGFGTRRALVDIDYAAERLHALYGDHQLLAEKSRAARAFALGYQWPTVVAQWDELLRARVPALREATRRAVGASRVTLDQTGLTGPRGLTRALGSSGLRFPEGAQVTLSVVQAKAGELTSEVLRDAADAEQTLTLPPTRSSWAPAPARRETGLVFVGGDADIALVRALARIFPGLRAWSCRSLDLGIGSASGRPVRTAATPIDAPQFQHRLAATTLALDCGGGVPELRERAARWGVPCIGPATSATQLGIWPELAFAPSDGQEAFRLARAMLTDQGASERICALALQRLESVHQQQLGIAAGA
jgi:glycosyltransferase involved in cell wall biosynthesis